MQTCLGWIYAWSAFVPSLQAEFGYTSAQTQLVFGTTILVFTFSMVFTGPLHDRFGPRPLAMASGALLLAAYLLASVTGQNFFPLWLSIGVLGGLGLGCGYVCPIATAVKWFPKHKGLVIGVTLAGYGLGAVILANLVHWLLNNGWEALKIFRLVGITFGPVILLMGLFLFLPYAGGEARAFSFQRKTLLRDKHFWRLCLAMFCGTFPGLVINGNLKPIGLSFGFDSQAATAAIGFFAIGNAAGRIDCGVINDWLGGEKTTRLVLILIAVSTLTMVMGGEGPSAYLLASFAAGFCYGGNFSLYPAQVAQIYGAGVLGSVYALVLLAHGAAAEIGPVLGGYLHDLTGSFFPALILSFVITVIGLAGYWYLNRSEKKIIHE